MAEALIALLEEGDPAPTAKAVANRADVSVRLVFHHFEDMETLYSLVMSVQMERHWSAVRQVDAALPLAERIEETVRQRARLFEAISPARRACVGLASRRAEIAAAIGQSDDLLRRWLESTFSPELGVAAPPERRDLLAALDAAGSWEAWDRLRRCQQLSASKARRVMARTLSAIIES